MLLLLLFGCAFIVQFVDSSPLASPTTSTPINSTIPEFAAVASSSPSPDTCKDIDSCRTQYTIVWSSLLTIFACVWTAIHRNVPAPKEAGGSRRRRIVGKVWEATKIVVVTILVPEWVLSWAVRQFLTARHVREKLERARGDAERKWKEKRERLKVARQELTEVDMMDDQSVSGTGSEASPLLQAENDSQSTSNHARESVEKSKMSEELAFDGKSIGKSKALAANKQIGRLDSSEWDSNWTIRHGFFVIMGGFHHYKDRRPQHPLSPGDVVQLVKSGDLAPPTDEEIGNLSQTDVLSKTIAIFQTLWFVVQAIARGIEGLPITQLEIMTLAYTVITVAMYVAWWDKPQNVGGPVRVAVKQLPEPGRVEVWERYLSIFAVIAGAQDQFVDLRKERCVPTFYSGSTNDGNAGFADIIALCAAMMFGAVHCAAWHYAFPTDVEKIVWRVSSLAIVALPAAILAPMLVSLLISRLLDSSSMLTNVFGAMFLLVVAVSALLYIAARSLLLALSFSTLRSLPPEAYRAVQWTLLIPHFT
ncbi:hypothetical protein BV25DRAFT_1993324 [Artomyces pyxidatus]|uniref:Uncharacterized protein n=1 Tax=Artomyces pyxidatus TaxID=48021 RepID=A0ACB8SUM9_9AGAM|nr:hypothetical protein BV25DRAFT_1993324 [Artomyces pyxidatus]